MGGMQINARHTYPAPPDRVVAMMRTESFLDQLAKRSGALSHSVDVSSPVATLRLEVPAPESLSTFIGKAITLVQSFRWDAGSPDGTRRGTLDVEVPGMPITMNASGLLSPDGDQTIGEYAGDFTVRIPIVGRKVEKAALPFITDALDGLQRVGTDWLQANP